MMIRDAVAAALTVAAMPVAALAADARDPTVVEPFWSQGCSSCPPALANVNAIVDRPDVLALTFAVTSWDQLGWKDAVASPAFTARQWDYARSAGRPNVAVGRRNGKPVRIALPAGRDAGAGGKGGPIVAAGRL